MTEPENDSQFRWYPAAMVNITNRCTLRCKHCFIYRDGNPNQPEHEMETDLMLRSLTELQQRHNIHTMLWMGGEPLLRPDVLREGSKIFQQNNVTTNGTLDLIDLPNCIYVVSVDGPPQINDSIRGNGAFERVMRTLARVPDVFGPTVMVQCVVTKLNEDHLEELVERLLPTRVEGMTFSFYVPRRIDDSDFTWGSLDRRDKAVLEVIRLKKKHPDFIWNNSRSLELTLSQNARAVVKQCLSKRFVLPLWLEGDKFINPFCCYGNDVDCELCGAWVVFHLAARRERSPIAPDPSPK
ncbi:MAG: radical SAM protein [Candidatus Abyssobacteria bacterium SURF_5]|uniref:Radical SAM protein n=1 Tax=Abyssobacteria bacterium (strain SURF_5) TaxID=2093360 RepID=A0A3A4P3F1_ABYX5|nr:MAG: radical SAM protein [Candidatus Abyssubacteria bacterium SURF_5]